ncbi:MAG: SusC/RagA family TonB-linked outer membrane protein, partial [Bacteroidales bacterium]
MVKKVFLLATFLLGMATAFAQEKPITGKVVDETGAPLPGATVKIKGTDRAAVTDVDGQYKISAAAGATLVFSYVGYQAQEIAVGESNVIDVAMKPEVTEMTEVVVVGYGVQKKSLVTGAISKIKSDELVAQPNARIEQSLQGRTAGVVFNKTSGNPGAQITVRVRGVSSNGNADPLFIIDGMKTSKYVFNEINPNDIESVEVLKDAASSAIYGSEGANGVIIVTTKTGKGAKGKVTVSYDGYYGWQQASYAPVMSASQYRDYFAEAYAYDRMYGNLSGGLTKLRAIATMMYNANVPLWSNENDSLATLYQDPAALQAYLQAQADKALKDSTITNAQYNSWSFNKNVPLSFEQYKSQLFSSSAPDAGYGIFRKYVDTTYAGTDWMNEIFSTAPMQSHTVSATTGNENANLYLSASYYTQDGVVGLGRNNFTRYTFKINGDVQANKWLKLGTNVNVAHSEQRNIPVNDLYDGVISAAMSHDPTIPAVWNDTSEIWSYLRRVGQYPKTVASRQTYLNGLIKTDDGKWYSNTAMPVNERFNPLAKIKLAEHDKATTERVIGLAFAEVKPFEFLTYRTSYSAEVTYVTNDNWGDKYYINNTRFRDYSYVYKQIARYYNYQIDNVLTFDKTFNDHAVSAMVGQSVQKYIGYSVNGTRINLQEPNENWAYLDAVPQSTDSVYIYNRTNGGFKDIQAQMGYFGRVNYNYKEKYIISAILRRDGVSKFAPDYRFGYFPSVSGGWNVHNEEFFNVPAISQLKIRASWGRNGSHASAAPWQWISTKTATVLGGTKTIITGVVKNPKLHWETSEQIDAGFDLGLMKNRLLVNLDFYSKRTKDLLARPIKATWTDEVPYQNVGRIDNNGIDLEVTYTQRETEFKYTIKATGTYQTNEVKEFNAAKLAGYSAHGAPAEETAFEVGHPVWYFRGYKALGVFQSWEEIRNYTYTDPVTGKKTLIQPDAVPGDVKIADVGGRIDPATNKPTLPDGKIDANDFTALGKPLPTWLLGLNLDFEYKGFDLN